MFRVSDFHADVKDEFDEFLSSSGSDALASSSAICLATSSSKGLFRSPKPDDVGSLYVAVASHESPVRKWVLQPKHYRMPTSLSSKSPEKNVRGSNREKIGEMSAASRTDAFWCGAWPRDAAVDTHKQAGRQSTALTGASSRSCHVTKRFRILATLKQGNKSMYSNTSGYVHMGLRLDWGKGITGQYTLSPNSYPNPRSDPLSGWQGRGLKHIPCPAQSGP